MSLRTPLVVRRLAYGRSEETIASTRVALAALSLFPIWFDPQESASRSGLIYTLYWGYGVYSVVVAAIVWSRIRLPWLPLAAHTADLAIFSAFFYLTTTTPNPTFMYFVFILFGAALRWGWVGTLRTIPLVVVLLGLMGSSLSHGALPSGLDFNRLIIRIGYLVMVGALLVYLGRYEADRRDEIQQLARWPDPPNLPEGEAVCTLVAYGAHLLEANAAVVVWSVMDEPRVSAAHWSPSGSGYAVHAAREIEPFVNESLEPRAFICMGESASGRGLVLSNLGVSRSPDGVPIHPTLVALLPGAARGSAPFSTERLTGRVFVSWRESRSADALPLLEAVGRQMGESVDHLHARERQRRLAIGEERMRLARDLHDGVVQSLTGIRFELQRLWRALAGAPAPVRDRLLDMERALAVEQREIRRFIEGLNPFTRAAASGLIARHLEELGERLSGQWHVPIDVKIDQLPSDLPPAVSHAIVPMVQEAVTNALKHGHPSRVRVAVKTAGHGLELIVSDDGHGFDFVGNYDHETLASQGLGPASLRDRVASLGGRLAIKSGASGARVEMELPCQ